MTSKRMISILGAVLAFAALAVVLMTQRDGASTTASVRSSNMKIRSGAAKLATATPPSPKPAASPRNATPSFVSRHQPTSTQAPETIIKRLESHFSVFSRRNHRVAHASAVAPTPPPMIVDRYGLDLTQAVPIPLGPSLVGWAIPGANGVCLTAVPIPGANEHNPSGGSCSTSIAAAETQGVTVTTNGADGQRYVVGFVPDTVTAVNLPSTTGTITHPAVAEDGFSAPITNSGYRSLSVVARGKSVSIGTNSP